MALVGSQIVDSHVHLIPQELLRGSGDRGEAWRPRVRWDSDSQIVELEGKEITSMVEEAVSVERVLATVEKLGIDRVVISPWVPLLFPDVEAAACLERCRAQNEAFSALIRRYPDEIAGFGAIPLQDPELAASELSRIREAGLAGVEVTASTGGRYLGDERFEPFWAAAAETDSVVFVHPTTRGFSNQAFSRHYLWNSVGNPLETTIAAAQLAMAGVLERHPDLRVLLAHGGGAMPALRGRLRRAGRVRAEAHESLVGEPEQSLRRFFFDTITHDIALLRQLIEWAGAEHVLLGSDYPFDMADPDPVATVRSLRLEQADEAAILGGNADRLMGRRP